MKSNVVIEFNKVGKRFHKGQRLFLKQALLDVLRPQKQEEFWALKDISFKVRKGETMGIIGANGSGKSTILKLIAGVLTPTKGEVKVYGRIGPLIELGAGFHPELTGRENVYLNGTILGLTKKEIEEKFKEIVDFAQLWDFIDTPVKHYSSGMQVRLGFSVAVNINPEILVIDEILSVGDASFQNKSLSIFKKFKQEGLTTILVSHDLSRVEEFCDRVLYIENGKLIEEGKPHNLILRYFYRSVHKSLGKKGKLTKIMSAISCCNTEGKNTSVFRTGEDLVIEVRLAKQLAEKEQVNFGVAILDQNKNYIFGVNTFLDKVKVPKGVKKFKIILNKLPLFSGKYNIAVAIHGSYEAEVLEYRDNFLPFNVVSYRKGVGTAYIDHKWVIET